MLEYFSSGLYSIGCDRKYYTLKHVLVHNVAVVCVCMCVCLHVGCWKRVCATPAGRLGNVWEECCNDGWWQLCQCFFIEQCNNSEIENMWTASRHWDDATTSNDEDGDNDDDGVNGQTILLKILWTLFYLLWGLFYELWYNKSETSIKVVSLNSSTI